MKNYIINSTVATGVYVTGNVKLVKVNSFKISNTKQESWVVINGAERANITNCLFEENSIEKTLNEGDIQPKNCKTKIKDTIVKKQEGRGIVIENGSGKFLNSTCELI